MDRNWPVKSWMKLSSALGMLFFIVPALAQSILFGDTLGIYPRSFNVVVNNSVGLFDLDCDGIDDLSLEAISTDPNFLRRTSVSLLNNGPFEIAVFSTGKVKNHALGDTIQCLPPDLWTNFNYLAIGISSPGGNFGNCCFDHEYIGFRKIENQDTLLGWIRISTQLLPTAEVRIEEIAFQEKCGSSSLPDLSKKGQIIITPNPFSNYLQISFQENSPVLRPQNMQIYSMQGTLVLDLPIEGQETIELDTWCLVSGVYLIRIGVHSYKLIKS